MVLVDSAGRQCPINWSVAILPPREKARSKSPFARRSRRSATRPITQSTEQHIRPPAVAAEPFQVDAEQNRFENDFYRLDARRRARAESRASTTSKAERNSSAKTAATPATSWSPEKTTRWTISAISPASNG